MPTSEPKSMTSKQLTMTVQGHKITISFSQEYNPRLSALVRAALLDSYIQKIGLDNAEKPV